jgi:hypothetical protein
MEGNTPNKDPKGYFIKSDATESEDVIDVAKRLKLEEVKDNSHKAKDK